MLDRGEDADWFASDFVRTFAVLAAVGAAFACGWLLYARNPVVDLRVLKDRNFALGCVSVTIFAMILYGSAVLVPQLAQQHLGYTALLSGLLLSPGAMLVILMIPIVSVLMPRVQTRFIITFGFLLAGCSMLISRVISPDIDFLHLMLYRAGQSLAIGFLFVPISVMSYQTVAQGQQGDATALFTMFRNVAGSVGISLSTAAITARTQAHMAYLASHLSPGNAAYTNTLAQLQAAIRNMGAAVGQTRSAVGYVYQTLIAQAGFLAYKDVFLYAALMAFAFVPFTLLFSSVKAAGKPGAG
jgi:DHA2 family multidrug resistance protein